MEMTMNSKGPTREQFTDKEWQAVGNLFTYLSQLRKEGKIGRKGAAA
jgi:hypothetical protein